MSWFQAWLFSQAMFWILCVCFGWVVSVNRALRRMLREERQRYVDTVLEYGRRDGGLANVGSDAANAARADQPPSDGA